MGTGKKTLKTILIIVVALLVIGGGVFAYVNSNNKKQKKYELAQAALSNGETEIALQLLDELGNYKDSAEIYSNTYNTYYYSMAVELMNNKDYEQASAIFENIKDYKDSSELKAECDNKKVYQGYIKATQGDEIDFADYTWIVLENNGKDLYLAKSGVAMDKAYDSSSTVKSWGTSEIRKYLNGEYLNQYFSESEQKMILSTTINTGDEITTDKVFLLSAEDFGKYSSLKKVANDDWWLRDVVDTDYNLSTAMYVNEYGRLTSTGMYVNLKAGIIPAMWIHYGD